MSEPHPIPPEAYNATPPPSAETPAQRAAAEFTSRATANLANLTQYGMNLARLAHDMADRLPVTNPEEAPRHVPVLMRAFDRMGRTIRQTIALEGRLHAGPRLKPLAEPTPAVARRQLVRAVEDAIDTNAKPECRENLLRDLYERLDDPELDEDLVIRPLKDVIVEFCSDLGINAVRTFPGRRRSPADIHALHRRAAPRPPPPDT